MGSRRKGKSSPAEDLMDLVAMLPWWAGVLLAVVFYVWLHQIAAEPFTPNLAPGAAGSGVVQIMVKGLATGGQYILPVICLAGAAISAWRRRERRQLAADAAVKASAADALDGMSWQRFELLVGEAFRQRGFRVLENGGGGADGGVDLVLSKGSEKFLVQCKQWRAYKVGVDVVRQLYGVMAARGAAGGFVVTSGRFTQEAQDFARGRNVVLMDGAELHRMLQSAAAGSPPTPAPRQVHPQQAAPKPMPTTSTAAPAEPLCPKCGKAMLRRVAKQGTNAGKAFWGCSAYPACRGTRGLD